MSKPIRKIETFLQVPNFVRLFPPPKKGSYVYFDGAGQFPFEGNASGHSPQNAWWLAECSLLVYCEQSEVSQVLTPVFDKQKTKITWLDSAKTNTQGFILETADYFIIAFRGTEFPPPTKVLKSPSEIRDIVEDIKTDIAQVTPQKISEGDPSFDVPVHPGFAHALQSVWPSIETAIGKSNNKPLWLTGHSLGGAIATLLAFHIPERVAGLYTYGSPCVGNSEFVNVFNNKDHLAAKTFRYVHGSDAVANALPLTGLDYQPVGQLHPLDAGRRRGWFAQAANLVIAHTIKLNQFDHAPIIYSYECWNQIPG